MKQSRFGIVLLVWFSVMFVSSSEAGGPWYVTSSGTPGDGLSWAQAFTNIQTAIDTASDGDTIYLAAQTFVPAASAAGIGKLIWTNKALSILGGYAVDGGSPGALAAGPTIITNAATYQASTNRLLYITGVTNGTLARVKLTGGKVGYPTRQVVGGAAFYGAGIYMAGSINMILDSLLFDGNGIGVQQSGIADGAGLYATNSWGTISNCVYRNNFLGRFLSNSSRGGGVNVAGGGWTLIDCVIRDNITENEERYYDTCQGVGLYFNGGTHFVRNSALSRNYGRSPANPQGEALYVANGTVTVENCTFFWHRFEGVKRAAGSLTLRDCIVWECGDDLVGTISLQNCNIQDGDSNGVNGVISADPLFERGLYLATNSPCVNSGSRTAAAAGLGGRTTCADGALDAGMVDMGYHFAAGHAPDLYVSVIGGDDSYAGTNSAAAFKTLGKALLAAGDGVHINVAAGLYTTNTEAFPLAFPANVYGVQLLGTNAVETIIDARQRNARVMGMSYNYPGARVTGLTFRGADYQMASSVIGMGGGFYAQHSRGMVDDCVVVSNKIRSSATWGVHLGGGLYMGKSYFIVSNVVVALNSVRGANWDNACGGGIAWEASDGVIDACVIVSNQAAPGLSGSATRGLGGGVYLSFDDRGIVMQNCLIASNNALEGSAAGLGSGLYDVGAATVLNCTIVSNRATGVYSVSGALLTNSVVWGNGIDVTGTVSAAFANIGSGPFVAGSGCISADPVFVDAAGGNYRLALGSPCVNAGTNQAWMGTGLDLDWTPRINNSVVDMGAYEQQTPLYIVNRNPSNVTASTAYMNGELLSDAGSPAHVWLYWGPTDGTTNKNLWAHTNDFGVCPVGGLTTNINFGVRSNYFYRYYATNVAAAESWAAPSVSFDAAGGVSVVASDAAAAELGQDPGVFTLSRPLSSTGSAVTVNFSITGTALNGVDYQALGTNVVFAEGVATVTVTVMPLIDRIVEGGETVILAIAEGSYLIESPSTAAVTLADWVAPQTLCVSAGGSGTYATNWATAFSSIQSAIDAAQNNDTIYLAAQTFILPAGVSGFGKLVWTNKTLSLLGGYSTNSGVPGVLTAVPSTLSNTNSYSGTTNRLLYVAGVTNGVLANLKLVDGRIGYANPQAINGAVYKGAGLYLSDCTNMMLKSLVFDGNAIAGQQSGLAYGAALFATNSWGTITNCVVRNNVISGGAGTGLRGAGLYLARGGWTIRDNVIRDNTAAAAGAGIGLYLEQGTHVLHNCIVTRNDAPSASQGDALYGASAAVTVENCTFYWHRSEGVRNNGGTINMVNSIVRECGDDIAGTVTLQNCNTQDGDQSGSNGNNSSDPLYERGLYLSTNSPCIDAGSTSVSAAGLMGRITRIDGVADSGVVDMGYHFAVGVTDLYVSVSAGSDSNPGTSAGAPFKTISKACSVAGNGAHINVAAGTYTTNTETFPLTIANIYGVQLLGVNAALTVINPAGAPGRAVTMNFNYPDAAVRNLAVVNANWAAAGTSWGTPGTLGFGVYLSHVNGQMTGCTVSNSVITPYSGGGPSWGYPAGSLYATYSDLVIRDCEVSRNSSVSSYAEGYYAAGIVLNNVSALIANCVISSNVTTGATQAGWGFGYGSGLYLNGTGTVRNCLITGNSGSGVQNIHGQGVYVAAGSWQFENCTIVSNSTEGLFRQGGTVSVTNSILWGNGIDVTGTVSVAYSDVGAGSYTDAGNNKSVYPAFATNAPIYRVLKGGPCWNAGIYQAWMAGAVDLANDPRFVGSVPDMGCYEVQPVLEGSLYSLR